MLWSKRRSVWNNWLSCTRQPALGGGTNNSWFRSWFYVETLRCCHIWNQFLGNTFPQHCWVRGQHWGSEQQWRLARMEQMATTAVKENFSAWLQQDQWQSGDCRWLLSIYPAQHRRLGSCYAQDNFGRRNDNAKKAKVKAQTALFIR